MGARLLTSDNYKKGFLVDDEVIAGVTELDGVASPVFAAYISHHLTGETYAYQEFDQLDPALDYLATVARNWKYEAVGCGSGKSKTAGSCSTGGCGSGGCSTGGCK